MSNEKITEEVAKTVSAYAIRSHESYLKPTVHMKRCRRAAIFIVIPITVKNGEVFLLLTKRAKDLITDPSTVALPGGMRDKIYRADIDTALREAEEEIGLPPLAVTVLGILTLSFTLLPSVVCPVVGIIPEDFLPHRNPSEIEYAFYVSLRIFIEQGKVFQASASIYGKHHPFPALHYTHDHLQM